MRAVVTQECGGLVLAEVPRPVVPPGGGLVRVSLCGLCGSDLEKFSGAATVPGVVLGHEVVGWLECHGEAPVRVALAHHVPCGECELCRSGHSSLCAMFVRTDLDPGGFAEELAVTADHLADAVFPLPPEIDDVSATLLEPLSCVLRAVEAAWGLGRASPWPEVAGSTPRSPGAADRAGDREPAATASSEEVERPAVLVAGCGSVGLLFLSVLAAAAAGGEEWVSLMSGAGGVAAAAQVPAVAPAADGTGPSRWAPVRPGILYFMEPDPKRAVLAATVGARAWCGTAAPFAPAPSSAPASTAQAPGDPAPPAPAPRLAFVTALGALPAVLELLAPGGVAVVFAGGETSPPIDLDIVYRRELTLAGVRSGSPRHLRQALAALASGRLPLGWYRPEVVELAGLPEAAARYAQGEVLKVVARVERRGALL